MPIAAVQNDTQLAVWHQDESVTLIDIEFMVKKEVPVAVMKVYKMLFRQVEAISVRVYEAATLKWRPAVGCLNKEVALVADRAGQVLLQNGGRKGALDLTPIVLSELGAHDQLQHGSSGGLLVAIDTVFYSLWWCVTVL